MNAKKFSDAMSELDTKYVDEALNYKKKSPKPFWVKWGAMAACLCLIISSMFLLKHAGDCRKSPKKAGLFLVYAVK